jgi:hypothetical protein
MEQVGISYRQMQPNTGSYAWTVPNTVTTQALIRISNRVGGNPSTPSDVSNAVFTINLPTPLLTSPNGGEVWRSGNTHQITWDASTVASNVQLEYSCQWRNKLEYDYVKCIEYGRL